MAPSHLVVLGLCGAKRFPDPGQDITEHPQQPFRFRAELELLGAVGRSMFGRRHYYY